LEIQNGDFAIPHHKLIKKKPWCHYMTHYVRLFGSFGYQKKGQRNPEIKGKKSELILEERDSLRPEIAPEMKKIRTEIILHDVKSKG